MDIGGLQKFSTIDFPGILSAVVFTAGCNYSCWYCHNKELLDKNAQLLDENEVMEFLTKRKGFLEGVVVSGGEPTLQEGLGEFLRTCRLMGYKTKLDTNGSRPDMLAKLLSERLLDYVAVDLKTVPDKYESIGASNGNSVLDSINKLRSSRTNFEVRTTVLPGMDEQILRSMAQVIGPVPLYALQVYNPPEDDAPERDYKPSDLEALAKSIADLQPNVIVRAK